MKNLIRQTLTTLLPFFVASAYANQGFFFDVTATGTPADIVTRICLNGKGPFSCQDYRVAALNISVRPRIPNHVYPDIGMKIATPGFAFNSGSCSMGSNGYCLFSASDTSPQTISVVDATTPPVNTTLYAYIGDSSDHITKCLLNSVTGAFNGDCRPFTNNATPPFSSTKYATLHTFDQIYGYFGDQTSNFWRCPLNENGDMVTACTALTNGAPSGGDQSAGVTFHTFNGVTYGYFSYVTSDIWQCPMDSAGNFSGSCTALNNTPTPFTAVLNTSFYTFNGTTYAYVSDLTSPDVLRCPMNEATGGFSGGCVGLSNTTSPFGANLSSAFMTFGNNTYLYVSDGSQSLWKCLMDNAGGFNGGCEALTNSMIPFTNVVSSTFAKINGTDYAYIGNNDNKIWQCPFDGNGNFSGDCTMLTNTPSFNTTANVAIGAFK